MSVRQCLRGKVSGAMGPMLVRGYAMPPVLGPYTILARGENVASTRDTGYSTRSTVIPVEIVCENPGQGDLSWIWRIVF